MTRKKIRENVFCLLFRTSFYDAAAMKEQMESFAEEAGELQEELSGQEEAVEIPKDTDIAEIAATVESIQERLAAIDKIIAEHAEGWKLNRIAKADLTILRLATYEICYDEQVPAKVAINEAVELAKKFGGDKTPGFVNAILGKIQRTKEEEDGSLSITD